MTKFWLEFKFREYWVEAEGTYINARGEPILLTNVEYTIYEFADEPDRSVAWLAERLGLSIADTECLLDESLYNVINKSYEKGNDANEYE